MPRKASISTGTPLWGARVPTKPTRRLGPGSRGRAGARSTPSRTTRAFSGAIPNSTGDLTEWKHLEVSDLPEGYEGSAAFITGPSAVLTGGTSGAGPVASSLRASTAPQSPFFQLGLVGATVPGLKIEGEIGQQLGYLSAAGVFTVDFVILILIGVAFAHREQTRALIRRVMRRGR